MDENRIRQSFIFLNCTKMHIVTAVMAADNTAWRGAVLQKEEIYE